MACSVLLPQQLHAPKYEYLCITAYSNRQERIFHMCRDFSLKFIIELWVVFLLGPAYINRFRTTFAKQYAKVNVFQFE